MKLIALLTFAALLSARPAMPAEIPLNVWRQSTQGVVEQQTEGGAIAVINDPNAPHVFNPGPLYNGQAPLWDADDYRDYIQGEGSVTLQPGDSLVGEHLVYADSVGHGFGLSVSSSDRRGIVTLSITVYDGDGSVMFARSINHTLPFDSAKMVVTGPDYQRPLETNPHLSQVPDSGRNGAEDGWARLVRVVIRVTNSGDRTLRKTGVSARMGSVSSYLVQNFSPTGTWPSQAVGINPRWTWEE